GRGGQSGAGEDCGSPAPGANGGRQPAPGSGSLLIDAAPGGGVEATGHIQELAGDAGGQVGAEEGTGVADFLDGDVAAQRGAGFVVGQHRAEALDAGGGQGADRDGGDGVDADAVRAEAGGQVAYTGFQAGHGHAHDVVVGHGAYRAQIAQGQQLAIAHLHGFTASLGQGDEDVGAEVVGDLEDFTGGLFGVVAIQLVTVVETVPVNYVVDAFGAVLLQLGE